MKLRFNKIVLLLSIAVVAVIVSCKKSDTNPVPYVYTDVYIYTANPSFNSLNAVGGWAYVNGGVRGIIVYRRSNEEFVAFDRNCTFDPDKTCATLSVDKNNNILAADSCCGSKFNIYDGSVTRSPATRGLRQYNTYYNGSSLHITN